MNLFEQAYEYINEVTSHEQNHIKLIKWAISVHFNSAAGEGGGEDDEGNEIEQSTMPSRIGYYFSTIRYNNYVVNYEPKIVGKFAPLALFYTCNCKSLVGKQKVEDKRQFTIVYAIGDVAGLKDEIKHNPTIRKCFEKDEPAPNFFDPSFKSEMHRIAEEYVLYAKFYWKNDDSDALIVWQKDLPNLGNIIGKSNFAVAGSPKFRNKQMRAAGNDFRHKTGFYAALPMSKWNSFIKLDHKYNDVPYIEVKVQDDSPAGSHVLIHGAKTRYSQITSIKDPNNDRFFVGVSPDEFGDAFRYKMAEENIAEDSDWKEISLLNSAGTKVRRDLWGSSALKQALQDIVDGKMTSSGKKINNNGESSPCLAKETTLACDSASFERIAQMTNRIINMYNAEHKTTANVEANAEAESLTITGLSQKALDLLTSTLDKRGFKYTKM